MDLDAAHGWLIFGCGVLLLLFIIMWSRARKHKRNFATESSMRATLRQEKRDAEIQLDALHSEKKDLLEANAKLKSFDVLEPGVKGFIKKNKNGRYFGTIQPPQGARQFTSSDLRSTNKADIESALRKVCKTMPIRELR